MDSNLQIELKDCDIDSLKGIELEIIKFDNNNNIKNKNKVFLLKQKFSYLKMKSNSLKKIVDLKIKIEQLNLILSANNY